MRTSALFGAALLLTLCVIAQPAARQAQPPATPPPAQAQPAQDPQQQPPVIRTGINFVRVDVIVTDRKGNPVLDLKPEEFRLKEDGKAQAIESFSVVKIDDGKDIDATDIEAEATRLEALGARRVQPDQIHEHGTNWILMTDPEGNEFCVCDGGTNQS